jgi:hypothetical protein
MAAETRGMTYFQDNFKIYYNITVNNANSDWYIAYWDWVNNVLTQSVKYENSPIYSISTDWWIDYVVFGLDTSSTDLYIVQWLQRQKVRVNIEWSVWKSRIFTNTVNWWIIREWILYHFWYSKWQLSNKILYSYWESYPWYSKSLNPWFRYNWDWQIKFISLYWNNFDIYIDTAAIADETRYRYNYFVMESK